MIKVFYKSLRDEKFQEIDQLRPGSWIHISQATKEDLKDLCKKCNIDPKDLEDSLDTQEIPRIEMHENSLILFTRHPSVQEVGLYTLTLTIVLTEDYFITITPEKSDVIDAIIQQNFPLTSTQKSKLLFHILLKITQNYTNQIKKVRYTVIKQEMDILNIENETIVLLTKNEEILNQFLTSLVPMRGLLDAILSGRFVKLYEEDHDLLQDLLIAIKQSEDLCRVNVKSIRSLRDSYQILFTNDVNRTIKRLTAITIIFTIPTIIASVYGMNVELPLEKDPFAFLIIINIVIVISFVFVLIFLKKKWL